jgi:tetratricopeptide (TPR) repeat protein
MQPPLNVRFARGIAPILALLLYISIPAGAAATGPSNDSGLRAVEILSSYIDGGPASVRQNLSEHSPLRHASDSKIELLFGPVTDSRWQLDASDPEGSTIFAVDYSSGIDDLVTLELAQEDRGWMLHDIASLSTAAITDHPAPLPGTTVEPEPGRGLLHHAYLPFGFLLLGVLTGLGAMLTRSTLRVAFILIAAGAIAAGSIGLYGLFRDATSQQETATLASDIDALRDFRWRLESAEPLDLGPHRSLIEDSRTAALWAAQALLLETRESEAHDILDSLEPDDRDPYYQIVKARVEAVRGNASAAILAYERALERCPSSDALRLEVIGSCLTHGFRDRARNHLLAMEQRGSGHAAPHYVLAVLDAFDGDLDNSEKRLLTAMQLEPPSRQSLLSVPVIAHLLRRPRVAAEVRLFDLEERTWERNGPSGRPLDLSGAWRTARSGDYLLAERETAKIFLPGLASHAPPGTTLVDPSTWENLERQEILAAPDRLAKLASSPGSWLQPSSRDRLTKAVVAMEEENRWKDVDALTLELPERLETLPIDVIRARSAALQQLGRGGDAKSFAASAALAELKRPNPDAERLYGLGEMMATFHSYDIAIRLLQRAESLREGADLGNRIRQLSMNRSLQHDYEVHTTRHFEIRFPKETHISRARRIGEILEAELARIQSRLGLKEFNHCRVNLMRWNDFRMIYTQSNHILGFYDGAITVPLADVPVFPPEVVALLTHELTHAIVAEATGGKAPRWFQEAIAGRMQMLPASNAFNRYADDTMLPLALLDPVLRHSPDPELIEQAYVVSETLLRYFESIRSADVWNEMIRAFAAGMTTQQAVESVLDREFIQLDESFRSWGRSGTRVFVADEIVHYDRPDNSEWIRFSASQSRRD